MDLQEQVAIAAAAGTIVAAFGTLATAIFTLQIARANRESAKASQQAARAALAQVRLAGPQLVPLVGMDDIGAGWLRVALRNVGGAAAFGVRGEVTVADELLSPVNAGIGERRLTIEASENVDDKRRMAFLAPKLGRSDDLPGEVVIRYEDTEGRKFSTRLQISLARGGDTNGWRAIHGDLDCERPLDVPSEEG